MNSAIVIAGPTGVGKTKISIDLASELNAEIISSDSAQVYRGLNIGTAKITEEEMQGIKHHLIDIVEPVSKYSVGNFEKDVNKILNQNNFDIDGFPTVWIALDLLTFGVIVNMLDMASEKNLTRLSNIYGCTNNELLSWLKCISFIRNICAHNGNLIDIKVRRKPRVRFLWYNYIVYHEIKGAKKATNRFAIVLLIIIELMKQINPEYDWNNLYQTIKEICTDDKTAKLLGFQSRDKVQLLI